jgi:hypothetical protein
VFLLVVLATYSVVLTFLFFDNVAVALCVSNAPALAMLFATGVVLGRAAGDHAHAAGRLISISVRLHNDDARFPRKPRLPPMAPPRWRFGTPSRSWPLAR